MDLETAQITTTAKLPTLKQENGNSFKPVAKTTTNIDGTSTTLIPGHVTTEEKVQKKNDMKARSFRRLNKPDLDTMSMAFVSSPSSTNEVNTTYGVSTANTQVSPASTQVSTASTQVSTANLSDDTVYAFLASQPNGSQLVYEDLEQFHEDDIEEMDLKWQLTLLSMRTRRFFQKTSRKITINGSDTTGYDKSKVECFNCHKMGHFARECRGPRNQDSRNRNQDSSRRTVNVEETSSKSMLAIDGAGFNWSYMADDEVPTNVALVAFSDSEVHNDKTCSKTCLKSFETLKTQLDDLRVEFNKSEFNLANYKRGLASVEVQLVFYKKNEIIFCEQLAVLKRDISYKDSEISMLKNKLIENQIPDKSRKGLGFVSYNDVPPPPTGLFSPPNLDLSNSGLEEFQQPEFEGYGPKTSKNVSEDTSNEVRESPDAPMVEKLVSDDKLEKKIVFPTVAKIEFVRPKQQEKPVRKPVKYAEMYRPKAVNTARPNSAVVNVVRANQVNVVKASACWVWRPTKLNSASITLKKHNYVDARGRSKSVRLMNLDTKSDETEELCCCTTGGAKRGKITGKGTLKTSKIDFEDVYFIKKLWFNLFSVSQMCDKKNSVLFTDTRCFVLSPDFKLADESQATLDESMLWHRRLGHVNFKTINKLVKKNIVRGLPSKRFENNQTYVACLKGKQHKASCKSKILNSITQSLFMLHMDLFGPTFNRVLVVKPHNKTPYELFRGRTPALSFMRPFGWHVTILNTLDYLGKFDGKSDEGFFVGYSLNSKAFRVYNIRTRKVEENLHIRFLEDKPIIACDEPKWLFDIDVLTKSMNYVPVVAGTNTNDSVDGSLFDSSSKNASNDEPQPSSDVGKKDDEGVSQESGIDDQERPENSTQYVNIDGPSINTASTNVNTGSLNINIVSATVTTAPLEATHADFFDDETELDMSNITTTYLVPSTPNTRIHKDHSLDHVIGDVKSGVYRNKKDERGIVIRNKARLVAQGYTQEEGIDYDKVFVPVPRIEAIRPFLAYASFKDFVVCQMDVKSAFLYSKIEEDIYVCQPPGFEDPEFPNRVYKVEKSLYGLHQAPRA
ncbi:putative ribonuclease H-like domain-containing protein, partial [Tanacetum coccineum]